MPITQRSVLTLLATLAAFTSGCSHFKKSAPVDTSIAGQTDADFKTRWIEKRTGELIAQGQAATAARAQAAAEFTERYAFTNPAKK
jgi:hypothetical protein